MRTATRKAGITANRQNGSGLPKILRTVLPAITSFPRSIRSP
ncbi:hypothetical protein SAMN04489733_4318 [Amycolatopsis keratiniphila]|nr:hypothetical protein SAMN04489733_4318 [Amycolatopsis keratiniphila]